MAGIDGFKCSWRLALVTREVADLTPQGQGLLLALVKRYGRGDALPRQVEKVGDGVLALRASQGHNEFRLMFFHPMPFIAVGLHAFFKNQRKFTPQQIDLARTRKRSWEERSQD